MCIRDRNLHINNFDLSFPGERTEMVFNKLISSVQSTTISVPAISVDKAGYNYLVIGLECEMDKVDPRVNDQWDNNKYYFIHNTNDTNDKGISVYLERVKTVSDDTSKPEIDETRYTVYLCIELNSEITRIFVGSSIDETETNPERHKFIYNGEFDLFSTSAGSVGMMNMTIQINPKNDTNDTNNVRTVNVWLDTVNVENFNLDFTSLDETIISNTNDNKHIDDVTLYIYRSKNSVSSSRFYLPNGDQTSLTLEDIEYDDEIPGALDIVKQANNYLLESSAVKDTLFTQYVTTHFSVSGDGTTLAHVSLEQNSTDHAKLHIYSKNSSSSSSEWIDNSNSGFILQNTDDTNTQINAQVAKVAINNTGTKIAVAYYEMSYSESSENEIVNVTGVSTVIDLYTKNNSNGSWSKGTPTRIDNLYANETFTAYYDKPVGNDREFSGLEFTQSISFGNHNDVDYLLYSHVLSSGNTTFRNAEGKGKACLLYTSDAADE